MKDALESEHAKVVLLELGLVDVRGGKDRSPREHKDRLLTGVGGNVIVGDVEAAQCREPGGRIDEVIGDPESVPLLGCVIDRLGTGSRRFQPTIVLQKITCRVVTQVSPGAPYFHARV